MPNWTYNHVHGSKKVIQLLLDTEGFPTFTNIVPTPPEFEQLDKIEWRGLFDAFKKYYLEDDEKDFLELYNERNKSNPILLKDFIDECFIKYPIELQQLSNQAIEKYGTDYWYDFNHKYYGCKWDACKLSDDPYDKEADDIEFQTPWSPPEPIIRKISEMYPEEEWTWHADEESCAFSIDYHPDGHGGVYEEDVFPEYYTPYIIDDENYFRDEMKDCHTKDEILGQIDSLLPEGSPRDIHVDESTHAIEITVYDWEENGGDKFFSTTLTYVD